MRKLCPKCDPPVLKDESEFNKGPRGTHNYCKPCQRAYDKARYTSLDPSEKSELLKRKAEKLAALKETVRKLKESPCNDCAQSFPYYVMDFDHRDPQTKLFNVGDMLRGRFSLRRILDEIAKCDLLCSNCHRIRTHRRVA